jgi:gamma-glutamyltranspeptidase/glutathione hydrolase
MPEKQQHSPIVPSPGSHAWRALLLLTLLGLLNACAAKNDATYQSAAEPASQDRRAQEQAMVVTANPHATDAGEAILRAGGSAVDAAVAIESVLSLVEPQSSGLGGGGFMVYYHAADQSLSIYDGREVAPAGAKEDMFLDQEGETLGYIEAKNSGLSIGVPGVVAMLALAHSERGELPWSSLFDPAVRLATEGFTVSPRLRSFFETSRLRLIPTTAEQGPLDAYEYFFDSSGQLRDRLENPDYARTLALISSDPRALYEGELAAEIVAAAAQAPRAGTLSLEDLAGYAARKHEPLCTIYRDLKVCGPPPPSSWVAVGMTLGLLEESAFPSDDVMQDWSTFIQAQRLAYADRDHFVADDSAVPVPLNGMLDRAYLRERAKLINADNAAVTPVHGDPWRYEDNATASAPGQDTTIDYAGTTHFVVADRWGNVVSMTASVESIFGSTRMAGGMFLNNQLTDFAKQPRDKSGALVANHPAPGKRPRSSMSPTIVLNEDGSFRMATGSPGGNSIIAYTLKTLVGVFDWKLSPQEAVNLPNIVARGNSVRIESDKAPAGLIPGMRELGFPVRESAGENSGLSVVYRHADGSLEGGVDPRREGTIASIPGL